MSSLPGQVDVNVKALSECNSKLGQLSTGTKPCGLSCTCNIQDIINSKWPKHAGQHRRRDRGDQGGHAPPTKTLLIWAISSS